MDIVAPRVLRPLATTVATLALSLLLVLLGAGPRPAAAQSAPDDRWIEDAVVGLLDEVALLVELGAIAPDETTGAIHELVLPEVLDGEAFSRDGLVALLVDIENDSSELLSEGFDAGWDLSPEVTASLDVLPDASFERVIDRERDWLDAEPTLLAMTDLLRRGGAAPDGVRRTGEQAVVLEVLEAAATDQDVDLADLADPAATAAEARPDAATSDSRTDDASAGRGADAAPSGAAPGDAAPSDAAASDERATDAESPTTPAPDAAAADTTDGVGPVAVALGLVVLSAVIGGGVVVVARRRRPRGDGRPPSADLTPATPTPPASPPTTTSARSPSSGPPATTPTAHAIASSGAVPAGRASNGPIGTDLVDVLDASRRMTAALDADEVRRIAVADAVRLAGAQAGAFLDVLDDTYAITAATHAATFVGPPAGHGPIVRVVETGQAVRSVVDDEPALAHLPAALAAVPVIARASVVGAIVVVRSADRPFCPSELATLELLAPVTGQALASAEAHRLAREAAEVDGLTQLRNRRSLDRDVAALSADTVVGFAMVDVDHFKTFNDTQGHAAGDVALQQVAAAIAGAVRESDVVYRYGGEEFAVLLRDCTVAEGRDVLERVREAVEHAAVPGGDTQPLGRVTVSLGLATGAGAQAADLQLRADEALYAAKEAGRNRLVVAP